MIRMDAVTLRQIRALVLADETRSLGQTAQIMGLSAPAVHSLLRNLETAVGVPLIGRSAPWGELTQEGRILGEAARKIELLMLQSGNRIAALAEGRAGTVRMSCVSTAKYFAPHLVRLLRDSLPGIEIRLSVDNREGVIRSLDEQNVDMAIMGRPPRRPLLDAATLGPHPHGVLAPPDHPLAGRSGILPDDLAGETFIAREPGSGTRILMQRYLDAFGEGDRFSLLEMASNETIKQAVMAGLGIAFLSLHTVQEELANGRLVCLDLPDLPITRSWFVVRPRETDLTPAGARVWSAIVGLDGAFLPGRQALAAV